MTEKQIDFIKTYRGMLESLIADRMEYYKDKVVDEEDIQMKTIYSLLVKELRRALVSIENIEQHKEEKEDEFTGV